MNVMNLMHVAMNGMTMMNDVLSVMIFGACCNEYNDYDEWCDEFDEFDACCDEKDYWNECCVE